MRFYTETRLGEKQSLTPEGFLLCEDVPLSRTGEMIYGPGQTTLPAGPDGIVHIWRTPEQVFDPDTLASFEGKPFVLDHPDQPDPSRWTVDPDNWRSVAKGHVIAPRQGRGADDDCMLADLLITDAEGIAAIRNGRREVSCGYEAKYVCDKCGDIADPKTWDQCTCAKPDGRGQQVQIRGNHVALVERGRCGSRCAIGDSQSIQKEPVMSKFKARVNDALKDFFGELPVGKKLVITRDGCADEKEDKEEKEDDKEKAKDKNVVDALDKIAADYADLAKAVSDGFKDVNDRLDKFFKAHDESEEEEEEEKKDKEKDSKDTKDTKDMKDTKDAEFERELEEEAPAGQGQKARMAKDSAYLEDSYQEMVSFAEIISPGFRVPTFDRASDPKRTFTAICRTRRQVLDLAYSQAELRAPMDELLAGKQVNGSFVNDAGMTCDTVRGLFRAIGLIKKSMNNDSLKVGPVMMAGGGTGVRGRIKNQAELNARMAEFYKDVQ